MAKGYARKCFQELLQQQLEKMSLKELALRLGKSQATLRKWLGGHQSPTASTMEAACLKLGLDPALLQVTDGRFQDIWRRQHFTFEVLDRRYLELTRERQLIEAVLMCNMCGVLLIRELAQQGFPMRLSTSDVGDVQLVVAQGDTIMDGIAWRIQGSEDLGLRMAIFLLRSGALQGSWLKANLENLSLLRDACATLHKLNRT